MVKLETYIQKNYDQSFGKKDYPFKISSRKVKKGEIIYPYAQVGKKMFFLNSGIVETTIVIRDIEKTLSFIIEGNFFGPFASILTKCPSELQGMAITDCEYEEFTYSSYEKLCERSLLANKIGRIEVENYYLNKYQRERDLLIKSKDEMYLDLLKSNPYILQNVPLKKIANYFGILPETLSRIRKKTI